MKRILLSILLVFFFIPSHSYAQSDYCECIEVCQDNWDCMCGDLSKLKENWALLSDSPKKR